MMHSRVSFPICSYHDQLQEIQGRQSPIELLLSCFHIRYEPNDSNEIEDLWHLNIKESKGHREVEDT